MSKYEIISHIEELPVYFNYYTGQNILVPSHWHQHIEVLYISKGAMEIITNDATYLLQEKDIFIINSEVIHLTKIQESTTVLLLQIPYTFFEKSINDINDINFKDYLPYSELHEHNDFTKISACLLELLEIYQNRAPGYPLLFNRTLYQLLYEMYAHFSIRNRATALVDNKKNRVHLQKAIDYMALHYNEHISLSDIASHLALNPEYFCRMFKKNMGFTFLEYLNQIRLTYIYKDLMQTSDSVTTIQQRHHFTNYKVFNRMFKESYGCTPSQARKRSLRLDNS